MVIGENMTTQNYLQIQDDVVTNIVYWDGNPKSWTPPAGAIMLIQATTPAIVWQPTIVDGKITEWNLATEIGQGDIGFTWDGENCITNQPEPLIEG